MGATTRLPIRRWGASGIMSNLGQGVVPRGWAALVDNPANDKNEQRLPAAARATRFAGLLDVDNVPATIGPANGDPITILKSGCGYVNLPQNKSVLPGDIGVIANANGDVEAWVPGTGTVEALGWFQTKYTNTQSEQVPVEFELRPHYIMQCERVDGFIRTIGSNNTRYIGRDATELSADEWLFEAPWDGLLQGPFRVSLVPGVGPAGLITAKVRILPPAGSWATAQVGSPGADWAVQLNAANVSAADDTSASLPFGNQLPIAKGTKVGFQLIKDNAIANIAQLGCRLTFY